MIYRTRQRFYICFLSITISFLSINAHGEVVWPASRTATSTDQIILPDGKAATSTCFSIQGKSYLCNDEPIEPVKREPEKVRPSNYSCAKNAKPTSQFQVCNNEEESITVVTFTAGNKEKPFAKLHAPKLPLEIKPSICIDFEITSGDAKAYRCGGFYDIILGIESTSPEGVIQGTIAIGM